MKKNTLSRAALTFVSMGIDIVCSNVAMPEVPGHVIFSDQNYEEGFSFNYNARKCNGVNTFKEFCCKARKTCTPGHAWLSALAARIGCAWLHALFTNAELFHHA